MARTQARTRLELEARAYKAVGDDAGATRAENAAEFADTYDRLIGEGRSEQDAAQTAFYATKDSIKIRANQKAEAFQGAAAVSSLAAIGGGGNVGPGAGDPSRAILQEQADLQADMRKLLEKIETNTANGGPRLK